MSLYRRFKDRFGTAGVVLGVIAIVLAVGGSAIAASGLNGKQKKEVKAIAKSFQGTGPQGAPGAPGTNGTNGKDGAAGTAGTNGINGKNVAVSATAPGCTEGGITVQVAGEPATAKEVCNGEEGAQGNQGTAGSPWTLGGTLPPSSASGCPCTETGAWALKTGAVGAQGETAISFPIPLATPPATKVNSLASGAGDLTEGSTTITSLAHANSTPPWTSGTLITGEGIPAGTEIVQFLSATEAEISNPVETGKTSTGVALSSPVWSQCDDGAGEPATAEHPEADPGFACVFAGSPSLISAGRISMNVFKAGGGSFNIGTSTAGARIKATSTSAETAVTGTFAVTG